MINISFKEGALEVIAQKNIDRRNSGERLRPLAEIYDEEGCRILDIGIHGDIWPGGHSVLFEKAKYETLDIDEHVQPTHTSDIRDTALKDELFDMIICHSVIEHVLEDRPKAYKEIFRMLKRGGTAVYVIPIQMEAREVEPASFVSITEFRSSHHGKDITVQELEDRCYFIVVRKDQKEEND